MGLTLTHPCADSLRRIATAGFSFPDHTVESNQNRNPKAELQMWGHATEAATEPLGSNGLSFGPQDLVETRGLLGPCRPSPSPLRSPKAPVPANPTGEVEAGTRPRDFRERNTAEITEPPLLQLYIS